jgi:hypothetical protein
VRRKPYRRVSALRAVRRLALVLALAAVASSGCLRPLTADDDPARQSVNLGLLPFSGEPFWANGTAHVSLFPPELAALTSPDQPHNCFVLDDDENVSYLGGVLVDLAWDASSPVTQELNVTVAGSSGIATWSFQGPSPLHLIGVVGDDMAVKSPVTVRIGPAGVNVPLVEQPVEFHVALGALESRLTGLEWRHCSVAEPPVGH